MLKRSAELGQLPVLHKFVLVNNAPRKNKLKLLIWKRALDYTGVNNVNYGFATRVFNVEMRRVMVGIVQVIRIP